MGFIANLISKNVFLHIMMSRDFSERTTISGNDGEFVNSTIQFGPSNFTITAITAYEMTENGGWLSLTGGGMDDTHLTLKFISEEIGLGIDYEVIVFGISAIRANHFRRGTFYRNDWLLYS